MSNRLHRDEWPARAFARLLRWSRNPALAHRQDEMVQAFRDGCTEARRRAGWIGLASFIVPEFVDATLGRAWRPASTRVSESAPPSQLPRRAGSGLFTDIRHARRALGARAGETALVIGLLAGGVATTGSIFAVADALIVRPAPFPRVETLVQLWSAQATTRFSTPSMPRDLALHWLDDHEVFVQGGAVSTMSALVTTGGEPELIPAARISAGLIETLGVAPILGRTFTPSEEDPGADHVVLISDSVWTSRFQRSPDVIGRQLRVNDTTCTVVGVMPASFRYPYATQRLWLPLDFHHPGQNRQSTMVTLTVRLRPDVTRDALESRVAARAPELAKQALRPWQMGVAVHYMNERLMDTQTRRSIWLLFGATIVLMAMVCTNVANVGLSRAFARTREAAIRSALGASRWRLIRQTLVEQLMIGAAALLVAWPLTAVALRVAAPLLPIAYTMSSLNPIDVDVRLIGVLAALALGAPLLAGLVPAVAGSRASVVGALKQEGRGATGSRGARRFRAGLVVTEVACAVVLLVAASLLSRSFLKLQSVNRGFDSHNLIVASVGFPSSRFGDGLSRQLFVDQALARVRGLPGVTAATAADGIPPDNGGIQFGPLEVEGGGTPFKNIDVSVYSVRPDFFSVLSIALKSGRPPRDDDGPNRVVMAEALAAKFWPGQDAVGKRFRWEGEDWIEVIGVAPTLRDVDAGPNLLPQLYQAARPFGAIKTPSGEPIVGYRRFAVRVADPVTAIPLIRAALRRQDSAVVVNGVDRVDDLLAKSLDRPRFLLVLMLVFAGAGLVLAAAGVYGVMSCLVSERMREYGIRLMLGASPVGVARAIVRHAVASAAIGLIVGLAASALLGRAISAVLFDVEARDAMSYVVVAGVLLAAATGAAWRPARRGRLADPAALLRND